MGMCVNGCGTEPYGRLPTYLYPRGSSPNVVQKEEISCLEIQDMCVDLLFRSSKYVVLNLLCGCSEIFNWENLQVFATTQKRYIGKDFMFSQTTQKCWLVVVVVYLDL